MAQMSHICETFGIDVDFSGVCNKITFVTCFEPEINTAKKMYCRTMKRLKHRCCICRRRHSEGAVRTLVKYLDGVRIFYYSHLNLSWCKALLDVLLL